MGTDIEGRLARELPAYARRVVDALEAAGYEAWVVGGWVRDALLGTPGHDVDVTTSAPWQKTAAVLRAAGIAVHETGTAHGTVTAVVGGRPVETTTRGGPAHALRGGRPARAAGGALRLPA